MCATAATTTSFVCPGSDTVLAHVFVAAAASAWSGVARCTVLRWLAVGAAGWPSVVAVGGGRGWVWWPWVRLPCGPAAPTNYWLERTLMTIL